MLNTSFVTGTSGDASLKVTHFITWNCIMTLNSSTSFKWLKFKAQNIIPSDYFVKVSGNQVRTVCVCVCVSQTHTVLHLTYRDIASTTFVILWPQTKSHILGFATAPDLQPAQVQYTSVYHGTYGHVKTQISGLGPEPQARISSQNSALTPVSPLALSSTLYKANKPWL